jgi:hypothetical protein
MLPSARYRGHVSANDAVDAVRDVMMIEAAEAVASMHSVAHAPDAVLAAEDQ